MRAHARTRDKEEDIMNNILLLGDMSSYELGRTLQ